MEFEALKVSLDGHVARIELNRPERANAMNRAMWRELPEAMRWLDRTPEARVGIISGAGKYFTAGMDQTVLEEVGKNIVDGSTARMREELRLFILECQDSITAIEHCRKPLIAAVHGACVGGGVDLITACDLRYCSAEAYFCVKEVDLAAVADAGTLQRLPRLIGEGMARELAYTGRKMSGAEAQEAHLVNRCLASREALDTHVAEIARSIAEKSPITIRGCKEMITYVRDHSVTDGLNYVATWNAAMLSMDFMESVQARSEGRAPKYGD